MMCHIRLSYCLFPTLWVAKLIQRRSYINISIWNFSVLMPVGEKTEVLGVIPFPCHFVHHKTHMDWLGFEPGPEIPATDRMITPYPTSPAPSIRLRVCCSIGGPV